VTGSWLSQDPIGFNGGQTNLYGYSINDPVNFVDEDGLSTHPISDGMGGTSSDQLVELLVDYYLNQANGNLSAAWDRSVLDRKLGYDSGDNSAAAAEHFLYTSSQVSQGGLGGCPAGRIYGTLFSA
jgi:uncharacterized protein RhaS with RHS repeats